MVSFGSCHRCRVFSHHLALMLGSLLLLCLDATAQTMPQDNWGNNGRSFASPVPANQLRCIAIGSGGVYVGEVFSGTAPNRILRFTEQGTFVSRFDDTLGHIVGLACDAAGNVYVLDRSDSRVRVYDATGALLRQWGSEGSGDGEFSLPTTGFADTTMISASAAGEVYVCDYGNNRVQVFNSNGTLLRKWGQAGSLPGQFSSPPAAITVSADGSEVCLVDYSKCKAFTTTGQFIKSHQIQANWYRSQDDLNSDENTYQWVYPGNWPRASLATSMDNLIISQWTGTYYNVGSILKVRSFRDNLLVNIGGRSEDFIFGIAVSGRGDIFRVFDKYVSIYQREYANERNFLSPPIIPQPMVTSATQRSGTNLFDVDYRVTDADSATVTTALLAVRDPDDNTRIGNSVAMRSFVEGTAGNVGPGQPTGVMRHVTWNMPADWSLEYATIRIEALAKDDRNLLGIHWITVPASGGKPAFQVSAEPVTDEMLRDLWLWFMATGQGVTTSYRYETYPGWLGTIRGTGGLYTNSILAEDNPANGGRTRTTSTGRLFATEKLGARPISADEKARALAGKFGFSTVDDNSIVKTTAAATSYLKGYGNNDAGQATWVPVNVPNISQISAHGNTTLFLTADGALYGIGQNSRGQLGDGTTTSRNTPVLIASGVAQASAGQEHSLFVKADGSLWAMGSNDYGQFGNGGTTSSSTPVQVATDVSNASAGNGASFFIKKDGTLWACGANAYGQLGDGSTQGRSTAVQIASEVAQCARPEAHTLFVKTDGSLWAMGNNGFGQFGDGTLNSSSTPIMVTTGVAQAATGGLTGNSPNFSFFVKTDGTLWAMGNNDYGQLGDGTTTSRSSPVQVAAGVTAVAAGAGHGVFLKADKTVWSMGRNSSGQLNDGTIIDRSNPVQTDASAAGISAGNNHTVTFTIP
jgi:alpha-tubulin suppressor-like RCC1 family protein